MQKTYKQSGFTLIELMITVGVVGLLAALAIPYSMRATKEALVTQMAQEFQIASSAFTLYSMESGDYPPSGIAGVIPDGMVAYFRGFEWSEPPATGGAWNWMVDAEGVKAAVVIEDPDWKSADVLKIDKKLDDGSLSTGTLRTSSSGYMYVVEEMN